MVPPYFFQLQMKRFVHNEEINKYKLLKLKWVTSHIHLLYLFMYFIFNCFFDGCMEKNLLICLLEREKKDRFSSLHYS